MTAHGNDPDIFDFVDYREFLACSYKAGKAKDPKFSHRFIVAQVRASSAGWFSDVIGGRANLSGNHILRFTRLFKLDGARAEYFESLVRFDQAASVDEKNVHFRRLTAMRGVKPDLIGKEKFEFYTEWYHSVIRELLFFHDFAGDYAELAKKLRPSIPTADAKRSIALLEGLGFIVKEPNGRYRPTSATLKKDPAFKAFHLANFLRGHTMLGAESLERFPKEERDISAITISLSAGGFEKAKEEIRALRERLLALTESDKNPERVFQCNFHMFPVTG